MNDITQTGRIYSILEINTVIQGVIRDTFPERIWVCGEVQDLRISDKKKHAFFTLVEKHPEADEVISKIEGVIFEDDKKYILEKLSKAKEGLSLREDIEVKLLCRVDAYPKWGRYQLIATDIDTVYTVGQLAQTRERILQSLKERGLLEKNKQCALPLVPLRVGLITSYNSAAYHDFISELARSGFSFTVHCFDAHMQGKNTERDIVRALQYFNTNKGYIDAVVITRGGGSTADLSWFDSQRIAEKAACAELPVLSAIGHEINCTITDLAAHAFFKTPTKAAQFLVERVGNFIELLKDRETTLLSETQQCVAAQKQKLQSSAVAIHLLLQQYVKKSQEELLRTKFLIAGSVKQTLQEAGSSVAQLGSKLKEAAGSALIGQQRLLSALMDTVGILSPQNTLQRGFSVTYRGGKVLKDAADAFEGDHIETMLFKGKIKSTIQKKDAA